jgi:hypothetical protein
VCGGLCLGRFIRNCLWRFCGTVYSIFGSEQIDISCQTIVDKGFQKIKIVSGVLAEECLALFQ